MSCKTLIAQLEGANNKILESKEVTDVIHAPLLQLIEQVKALGNLSDIKGMSLPEFYYYHATRVLRLVFLKALDRFSQAKVKMENPKVAGDFQALMPRIISLCTVIEDISQSKDNEVLNMRVLEKITDMLYEEALDRDFMWTPDEEMKIDNISGDNLKDILSLVQ